MYTISTMEAAIRPLGIVSNSSCGLLPFINWIRTARDIDGRFGLIKTLRLCYRIYRVEDPQYRHHIHTPSFDDPKRACEFLHVGLLNERGIENWLEIEVLGTPSCVHIFDPHFVRFEIDTDYQHSKAQGTVVFSPTCEALVRGPMKSSVVLVIEQGYSLVDLAMRIEDAQITRSDVVSFFFRYVSSMHD
jgi:hypothetical protein